MNRKWAWNTGALYTSAGQRIAAGVIEINGKGKIIFVDIDRNIDGEFPVLKIPTQQFVMEEMVMHHYNYGDYTWYPSDSDYIAYREAVSELTKFAIANAPTLQRT